MATEIHPPQRPASPYQALVRSLQHVIEEYELYDAHKIWEVSRRLGRNVISPIVFGLLGLIITYKLMKAMDRLLFPPPAYTRYQEALELYQQGHVRPALKAFETLQRDDKYVKAALSLAVHEIYMAGDAAEGIRILRKAKTVHGMSLPQNLVASMQDDAEAIQDGNSIMMKMNARMAKQEYLGVLT
jgi:hypothetical protein